METNTARLADQHASPDTEDRSGNTLETSPTRPWGRGDTNVNGYWLPDEYAKRWEMVYSW